MNQLENEYLKEDNDKASNPYALFVSLYLVVLAFFILLNTISYQDTAKTKKAVNSLSKVFSGGFGESDLNPDTSYFFDYSYIIVDIYNSVNGVIKDSLQLVDVESARSGNKMMVVIPTNVFFESGQSKLSKAPEGFLKHLTEILVREIDGVRIGVDLTIDSDAFLNTSSDGAYDVDVTRAKEIINHLISAGVPSDLITVGVLFNDSDNVTIKLTVSISDGVEDVVNE